MSNPTDRRFLLIGLPSTGKTSFLAALWYTVGQARMASTLTLDRVEGDVKYLNEIRDAWCHYRPVPRNKAGSERMASMWLKNRETNQVSCLQFPDLSGEAFRMQWTDRIVSVSYDKSLREAAGAILFLHPDQVIKPHVIETVEDAVRSIDSERPEQEEATENGPWDSEKSPTQVQLVEILQFMVGRHDHLPIRLAIVISAWDRIMSWCGNPSEWIATELPLLTQFLDSNAHLFSVSRYGISAQGGRYELPHFWEGNFDDCQELAKRLCGHQDAVSAWLWKRFEPTSQALFESIAGGQQPTKLQRTSLASDFNRLMAEPDIYDSVRFAFTKFRTETQNLLRRNVLQRSEERLHLVRLLLEDAYPEELSRKREHHMEATELQQRVPSDRVVVVDESPKPCHDITGPIQWLMQ